MTLLLLAAESPLPDASDLEGWPAAAVLIAAIAAACVIAVVVLRRVL